MFGVRNKHALEVSYLVLVILVIRFENTESVLTENSQIQCKKILSNGHLKYFPEYKFKPMCIDDSKSMLVEKLETEINSVVDLNGAEFKSPENIDYLAERCLEGAKITFMPNFKKMLPNLKSIEISNCGLRLVLASDMRQFGDKLIFALLLNNKITHLDADLFESNINLVWIKLNGNPLKVIDSDLFQHIKLLKSLKLVELGGANACIDQNYKSTKHGSLENFKWNDEKCRNTEIDFDYLKLLLQAKQKNSVKSVEIVESKILEIMWKEIESLKTNNLKLNEKMEKLESENSLQNQKLSKIEFYYDDLKKENVAIVKKCAETSKHTETLFDERIEALKAMLQSEISKLNQKTESQTSLISAQDQKLTNVESQCNNDIKKENLATVATCTEVSKQTEKRFDERNEALKAKFQTETSKLNQKVDSQNIEQNKMKGEILMKVKDTEGRIGQRIDAMETQNNQKVLELSGDVKSLNSKVNEINEKLKDYQG